MRRILVLLTMIATCGLFWHALWFKSESIEADITTRVSEGLAATDSRDILLDVDGRHVTLSGVVYDEATEAKLLATADTTHGALGPIDGITYQSDTGYISAVKTDDGILLRGTAPSEEVRDALLETAAQANMVAVTDEIIISGPEAPWQQEAIYGLEQLAALTTGTMTASAAGYVLSGMPKEGTTTVGTDLAARDNWSTSISAPDPAVYDENARLTSAVEGFQEVVTDLTAERDALKMRLEDGKAARTALNEEIAGLSENLETLTADQRKTKRSWSQTRERLEKARTERDEKHAQLKEMRAELRDAQRQAAKVDRATETIAERDAKIETLTADLAAAEKASASLAAKLTATNAERDDLGDKLASLQDELDTRKTALSTTDEKLATLTSNLTSAEANAAKLTAAIATRDTDIAALQEAAAANDAKMASLTGQLRDAEAMIADRDAKIDAMTEQVTTLDASLASKEAELRLAAENDTTGLIETLKSEQERLGQKVTAREDEIAGLRAEISALNATIAEHDGAERSLRDQIAALDADKATWTGRAETFETDLAALQSTLTARDTEIAALKSEVATLTGRIAESDATQETLRGQLASFDAEKASWSTRRASLEAELAALTDSARSRETEATTVGQQLALATASLSERDGKIRDLTAEIAALRERPPLEQTFAAQCTERASTVLAESRINFVSGSAEIEAGSNPLLERLTGIALACVGQGVQVEIGGHTDDQGSAAGNQTLSEARAAAVRAYMAERGVPAEGLRAVGYGETRPIADNATEEGRAANRRISFDWQPQ